MTAPWHFAGYRKRVLICIPVAHATATYFQLALGPHDGDFWASDGVQTNGYDVRFIAAHAVPGAAASAHNRAAWDATAKTATFNVAYVNPFSPSTGYSHLYWLYYDSETTVAVDPSTSVTTTTPVTASMWRGGPVGPVAQFVYPAEVVPSEEITVDVSSVAYMWFRVDDAVLGEDSWRGADNRMSSPMFLTSVEWGGETEVFLGGAAQNGLTQSGTVATETEDGIYVGLLGPAGVGDGTFLLTLKLNLGASPGGAIPGPGVAGSVSSSALLTVITPSEV